MIDTIETQNICHRETGETLWLASAYEPFPSRRDGLAAHALDRMTAVGLLVEFGLKHEYQFANSVKIVTEPPL